MHGMKIVVTGSAGHLGEALVRTLTAMGHGVRGIDLLASPFTTYRGSIQDKHLLAHCLSGADAVIHTATLHKPHVGTHSEQEFIDTNITGTLRLLEASVAGGVGCFIYTSTTSVFGDALVPPTGSPAAWVTEEVRPIPKNIYGVTKAAAEDLCQLFHRNHGMNSLVLRTSRFFPEEDDDLQRREMYADENLKLNEFLYRRIDLEDVVSAHLAALGRARAIGFNKYIISATTPFSPADMPALRADAPSVLRKLFPAYEGVFEARGWKMLPEIDRVYVNAKARKELGWQPRYDFRYLLERLEVGEYLRSPLARIVGSKGYHAHISA